MTTHYDLCIRPGAPISDAVQMLQQNVEKICLVVDDDQKLVGTITDGDIRRGLLRAIGLDQPTAHIMNRAPRTATEHSNHVELLDMMNASLLRHMPIIDQTGRLTGLLTLDDLVRERTPDDHWVVLMAGGLGERLRPLTESTPKPLLKVGNKPLLQTIVENFAAQDFRHFYISVNYQADAIKNYFGDGAPWGVEIRYLEEPKRMGTAGALSLLPEKPQRPLIVMNGDLVTRTDFRNLLQFHIEQRSKATMCVREYDFQVPFGVIGLDGNRIQSIDEKPVHKFFVNAGIYVLDPDLIDLVAADRKTDMTQMFETVIAEGGETAVFPIHEYWLDIGRFDDLERAKLDIGDGK